MSKGRGQTRSGAGKVSASKVSADRASGGRVSADGVDADRVMVAVRVKPGAARAAVGGSYPGPHGPAVIVAVSAPAVDGRATEAARQALATALAVKRSQITLHAGARSRDKIFTVAAPRDRVMSRVRDLLAGPE